MITVDIPGRGGLRLQHVVLDVNGTLTAAGILIPGVAERLARLRDVAAVQLLTADTRGRLAAVEHVLQVPAIRLGEQEGAAQKRLHVERLGADHVVAIGSIHCGWWRRCEAEASRCRPADGLPASFGTGVE
jgi:soluble P-type ATPase